jgi:signal transduction histidine kinase
VTQTKSGLGLVSMRERVFSLGGELAIDSRPSDGTRLYVRIRLSARATHEMTRS